MSRSRRLACTWLPAALLLAALPARARAQDAAPVASPHSPSAPLPTAPVPPALVPAPAGAESAPVQLLPVRLDRRQRPPFLTTGIVLLTVGYGTTLIIGGTLLGLYARDTSENNRALTTASGLVLIPVLGPFLSGISMAAQQGSQGALLWSLPWIVSSGGVQVAGLVMTILGAKTRVGNLYVPGREEPISILPYAALGQGGLLMTGRF